jgi:hypothetical protein
VNPSLKRAIIVLIRLSWALASSGFILPYLTPYGYRIQFCLYSWPDYLDRTFDAEFWRQSWGMSSDMVAGSVEGSYRHFEALPLSKLLLFAVVALLSGRLIKPNLLVGVVGSALFIWATLAHSFSISYDFNFGLTLTGLAMVAPNLGYPNAKKNLFKAEVGGETANKDE